MYLQEKEKGYRIVRQPFTVLYIVDFGAFGGNPFQHVVLVPYLW